MAHTESDIDAAGGGKMRSPRFQGKFAVGSGSVERQRMGRWLIQTCEMLHSRLKNA